MRKRWNLLSVLAPMFGLLGCSSSGEMANEWASTDDRPAAGYQKVMVASLLSNHEARRVFEDQFAEKLQEKNVEASKSLSFFSDILSEDFQRDKEAVFETISTEGNEAVLVISVLEEETETRHVKRAPYQPTEDYSWYRTFWDYYSHHYPSIYDPGYYTLANMYYVEANLYDAQSEKLVWSAQSETYDPVDLTTFARTISAAIVSQLSEQGLLAAEE